MGRPRSLPDKLVIAVVALGVGLLAGALFLVLKPDGPASGPGSRLSSGVYGRVLTVACNPVERVGDPPCPPYYGEIRVLRVDESLLMTAHTDHVGRYRVELQPGRYIVDSNDGGQSLANREGYVTVREGAFSRVDLTHWVGIVCALGRTWMHVIPVQVATIPSRKPPDPAGTPAPRTAR